MPARCRRRGRRAARAGVGGNARRVARRPGDGAAARARGASPAPAAARALRRRDRRLPGPLRPARGETCGSRRARALQPARLARRHARLRPRALSVRVTSGTRALARRPARTPSGRRRRRRHGTARSLPCGARRPRASRGLLRRRRGARLPTGVARRVHARALRRQADPAARAGDDPRGGEARARAPVPRRRHAASSTGSWSGGPQTSSGCPGSSTSSSPASSTRQVQRSGSSAVRRRPGA